MSEFRANRNSIMSHISSILPTRNSADASDEQTEMEKYFAAVSTMATYLRETLLTPILTTLAVPLVS
ncbi:hypothetical protein FBU59_001814 [Linderina macrospora]|uniref:Uncharacterized protein n=1 Tax=Linderina macrospora TaxID=4868 RepID=A0ACC1JCW4_9FUNG|nr:hypothetical protein FBU59_001814 [Linderina macrospora]